MEFNKRLKQLREENGILQKELAEKIGVSRVTITGYENGNREPDLEKIKKLAETFDVSIDYLIGYSDRRTTLEDSEYLIFIEKAKEKNYKVSDLIKLLDWIQKFPK